MPKQPIPLDAFSQIIEMFDSELTWTVSPDKSEATITFTGMTDPTGKLACDQTKLQAGYDEDNTGLITLDTVHDILQTLLPLAGIDTSTPNVVKLVRHNPMQFPYRGQIYDQTTSPAKLVGDSYRLFARTAHIHGHGNKVDANISPSARKVAYSTAYGRTNSPGYTRKQYYTFDVDFAAIDYPLKEDASVTPFSVGGVLGANEWERNTRIRFNPYLDIIVNDRGFLQYAEKPDLPLPQNKLVPFRGGIKLNERKGILNVSWLDVPADYILDRDPLSTTYRQPLQFQRCLGTVNSIPFLGCDAETLLLKDMPEMVSKPYGAYYGLYRNNYTFDWQYDINMKFIYFNPPKGKALGTHRGHNIFPAPGQRYYLYCTRPPADKDTDIDANVPNNPPAFDSTDFRYMFQAAKAFP